MKITVSSQNNNIFGHQKGNLTFGKGLTPEMVQEIQASDVLEISNKLAQKGIPADFGGDKFMAWCCSKTIGIFEYLNKLGQGLFLPMGIYGRDFEGSLVIKRKSLAGFCNLSPSRLEKGSSKEFPAGALFFNTFATANKTAAPDRKWIYDWGNVNTIADMNYLVGHSSTDHFLSTFIQELAHNAHLARVSKKIGGKKLAEEIRLFEDKHWIEEYRGKYGKKLSRICNHALENPLEAVACDMTRVITDVLDKDTLMPTRDPFVGTPYEKLSFWQRVSIPDYSDAERPLPEILRRFWNGKFE